MTNFSKVEHYYKTFDEWNRTFTPEGMLEFEITLDIMKKYTKTGSSVLDLGGGPGRYTQELAKSGRIMSLGDISPELVEIAKEKNEDTKNIKSIDVVNAVKLDIYEKNSFDCVLVMGPLYHLTESSEIEAALKEVYRILKKDGIMIAGFIPHLSGTAGIIERSMYAPHQVTPEILDRVFNTGKFNNNSDTGFQEGIYLSSKQVETFMTQTGFKKILLRSARGLGHKLEKGIIEKKNSDPVLYQKIMDIIEKSSEDEAVINTSGHALYVGKKEI